MSKPVPIWSGVVDAEGRIRFDARSLFDAFVRRLKGQPVTITVKKQTRAKSRSQLGYWHGVIIPILADHFGYREYEYGAVHDQVMRELRGLKPDPNPLKLRVSMSEMSHEQVSELIEDCRFWALDNFGVVIPDASKSEAA